MLRKNFFSRNTEKTARELLGKTLARIIDGKILTGIICETEAYVGPEDKASHASRGKTKRTKVMFGKPGVWYVYMIYGFYYCLNIVTEEKGYPAAVLIRAIEPKKGIGIMKKNRKTDNVKNLTNGPGKLCQAMSIDKGDNNISALEKDSKLYIQEGIEIPEKNIVKTKRVGVDYAGVWKDKPLRFYIKNSEYVSKR